MSAVHGTSRLPTEDVREWIATKQPAAILGVSVRRVGQLAVGGRIPFEIGDDGFEPDITRASWITAADGPWERVVSVGPDGFESYGTLHHTALEPGTVGQRTDSDDLTGDLADPLLNQLIDILANRTAVREVLFLLCGTDTANSKREQLSRGRHGIKQNAAGISARRRINSPNMMWPADHSWFVATDLDRPWTGVGGTAALSSELTRNFGPYFEALVRDA